MQHVMQLSFFPFSVMALELWNTMYVSFQDTPSNRNDVEREIADRKWKQKKSLAFREFNSSAHDVLPSAVAVIPYNFSASYSLFYSC